MYHQNTHLWWMAGYCRLVCRHENARFQENSRGEKVSVGDTQGTLCGLEEDCVDMLMSAWIWEVGWHKEHTGLPRSW